MGAILLWVAVLSGVRLDGKVSFFGPEDRSAIRAMLVSAEIETGGGRDLITCQGWNLTEDIRSGSSWEVKQEFTLLGGPGITWYSRWQRPK